MPKCAGVQCPLCRDILVKDESMPWVLCRCKSVRFHVTGNYVAFSPALTAEDLIWVVDADQNISQGNGA